MSIIDDDKLKSIFNMAEDESFEPVAQQQPKQELETLTPESVFGELQQLIRSGNNMLSTIESVISSDPDNPEMYQGASSLINSVKDTMKEFTKVYMEDKRHRNKMELEMLKIQAREKLQKQKLDMGAIEADATVSGETGLVSYSQEAIINAMNEEYQEDPEDED